MKERGIQILKYLMSNSFPVSLENLTFFFGISKRSIQYEIKEINEFLEKTNCLKFKI